MLLMVSDDTALSTGWFAPQSVALLLLATARAGAKPVRLDFISGLLAEHLQHTPLQPSLQPAALIEPTLEYIDALFQDGGLRRVFTALHDHCERLLQLLDHEHRRQVVQDMIRVVDAVASPQRADQLYAFPYAAARVWQIDDLAERLLQRRP